MDGASPAAAAVAHRGAAGDLAGLGQHLKSRETLLTENQALRDRQLVQDGQLLRTAELEAENERLRALLASATTLQSRVLIAEIMSVSQDPYRHQIVLNKGERDGVYKGQAVVDAEGIMGQVIEVNPGSSVALLVTDSDIGVPVEINRTGLQTIARGRGDGQTLSLPFLPGNADIKVGDLLVSSGLGGRYPPGYPFGRISELRHPAGENFMEGIAYPSARLNQGHQALLVWAEQPPGAGDRAGPDPGWPSPPRKQPSPPPAPIAGVQRQVGRQARFSPAPEAGRDTTAAQGQAEPETPIIPAPSPASPTDSAPAVVPAPAAVPAPATSPAPAQQR